jgi:nitric oxide reductase NorD protein
MDLAGVEAWLLACMDVYDTRGLHPAVAAFRDVERFAREHKARATGVASEDVVNVLEMFVHGLEGRRLKIECGEQGYTDTETLFLPASIARYAQHDDNFQLYKVMVVHQWAQTWFGTWRIEPAEVFGRFADTERAVRCFHALETLRLDACIRAALPGPTLYQGALRPEAVAKVRSARIEADRQAFRLTCCAWRRTCTRQRRRWMRARPCRRRKPTTACGACRSS